MEHGESVGVSSPELCLCTDFTHKIHNILASSSDSAGGRAGETWNNPAWNKVFPGF